MDNKQKVYQKLDELHIAYEVTEHPPVYTIEEMDNLGITLKGNVCKNLFLRDAKGTRHFLVVLDKSKQADLNKIRDQLGTTRLSFASEERLTKYLKLTSGAVTPLGVINDPDGEVELVFDKDLVDDPRLGVHPNDNTATVWISFASLKSLIERNGNTITYVTI